MVSCTNLVVRVRFGARQRTGDRAQRAWRRRAAGLGLDDGSLRRAKCATASCTAAASRCRNPISRRMRSRCSRCAMRRRAGAALDGTVELHFTYDEEVGGAIGPAWLLQQKISAPDFAISRGLFLRHHDRAQRLPASRGRRRRQVRPRRGTGEGHRRARGGDGHPRRPLRAAQDVRGDAIVGRRHRIADARRRADRRRHQHQRRSGPRHVPHRPPHHPGGESGGGRSDADARRSTRSRAKWPGVR